MKVLLAHNYYRTSAPSGEDTVVRNERRLLESHGVEVVAYEKHNDGIDDSSLGKRIRLALDTEWSRGTYQEFREVLRRTRPDVAHFHNPFPQISASAYAACRDCGVPVVQTVHNFRMVCPGALLMRDGRPCEDCLGGNLLPALRHRCYRGSLAATGAIAWTISRNRANGVYENLVDAYVALSHFAARKLAQGGLPASRIVVRPNFLPDPPPPGNGGGGYAIYVGRLGEEKGVRTLLAAWERVRSVPLVVVGDGPLRTELERRARDQGLDVRFTGMLDRSEVFRLVGEAMLQIVPSQCYENFPMVVLEAYACGTPVLASRIGSLDEIIEEGVNGFKFEAGDARDLADKVTALAAQPERLVRVRTVARQMVLREYSERTAFTHLQRIYDSVLVNKSAPKAAAAWA